MITMVMMRVIVVRVFTVMVMVNVMATATAMVMIDDDDGDGDEIHSSASFAAFVDHVLSRRGSSPIDKFRLKLKEVEKYPRVHEWICTAIRANVVELELHFYEPEIREEPFELPRSLFTCKSLVALKVTLEANYVAIPPSSDCFPSLKFLEVSVFFPDPATMASFFTCCPALEHLIIEGLLGWEEYLVINICAPKLRILTMKFDPFEELEYHDVKLANFSFNVHAPKLEKFDLEENFVATYSLSENSLNVASIDFSNRHSLEDADLVSSVDRIQRLFAGIHNVKSLSLQAPLLGDPKTEGRCNLPTLDKLNYLKLFLKDCSSWQLLTRLLSVSPNLENLELQINIPCCVNSKKNDWSSPKLVPSCLVSRLKTVSIRGFKGLSDDIEAAKYLLKHGEVLNQVTIYYSCDVCEEDNLKVCNKLTMSPKGSRTCQVVFPKLNMYEWLMRGVIVHEA